MAEKEPQNKVTLDINKLGGYTQDDPEYWVLLAKIIGNGTTEIIDDTEPEAK